MTDKLRVMVAQATADNSLVEVEEVRSAPSLASVVVTLRVDADSAENAAGRAERIYDAAVNLLGDDADTLVRRQSSLTYA